MWCDNSLSCLLLLMRTPVLFVALYFFFLVSSFVGCSLVVYCVRCLCTLRWKSLYAIYCCTPMLLLIFVVHLCLVLCAGFVLCSFRLFLAWVGCENDSSFWECVSCIQQEWSPRACLPCCVRVIFSVKSPRCRWKPWLYLLSVCLYDRFGLMIWLIYIGVGCAY